NALDDLAVWSGVAHLQPGDEREAFLLRFLGGGENRADAGAVHGAGLLGEDVLALLDGVLHVDGAEARRRGEEHDVHTAVDDLLVGVEADETFLRLDVDLAGDFLLAAQGGEALLDAVGEGVAHGDELDVLVGVERLGGGAGAPAAAADQGDLESFVRAGGVG